MNIPKQQEKHWNEIYYPELESLEIEAFLKKESRPNHPFVGLEPKAMKWMIYLNRQNLNWKHCVKLSGFLEKYATFFVAYLAQKYSVHYDDIFNFYEGHLQKFADDFVAWGEQEDRLVLPELPIQKGSFDYTSFGKE